MAISLEFSRVDLYTESTYTRVNTVSKEHAHILFNIFLKDAAFSNSLKSKEKIKFKRFNSLRFAFFTCGMICVLPVFFRDVTLNSLPSRSFLCNLSKGTSKTNIVTLSISTVKAYYKTLVETTAFVLPVRINYHTNYFGGVFILANVSSARTTKYHLNKMTTFVTTATYQNFKMTARTRSTRHECQIII